MRVRMRVRGWMWGVVLLALAAGGIAALGQQRGERVPAGSVGAELRGLASRAGVVFVGQVQKIENKGGVVEVRFDVQQPVLGVVGGPYVMREWAGRWTGGAQHYWVGERAMFFLHAPGRAADGSLGLSSPVDGMMGVVPVVPMGADGKTLLDVRWLAARVRRAVGAPLVDADTGAVALADAVSVARGWQTDSVAEPKGLRLPKGWRVGAESKAQSGPGSVGNGLSDVRR
ncbi:MAG: hypothetical protein WB439_04865 [Acidobacteriaceae bacterium]